MRNILGFFKVIILITLILASVYQTSKLWFEDSSDRNFFYRVLQENSLQIKEADIETGNLLEAMQLGVYLGTSDTEYTLVGRGDEAYEDILEAFDGVVEANFLEGEYQGKVTSDEVLWENQHFMLLSTLKLNQDLLKENFNVRTNIGEIDSVKSITIVPISEEKNLLDIYFESGETLDVYHYTLDVSEVRIDNQLLLSHLDAISRKDTNVSYRSTRKNRLPFYETTILLPAINRDIRYHSSLVLGTPFVRKNEIDNEGLSKYVSTYFENPDVVTEIVSKDNVRYTDTNVIVKYDALGVVEFIGQNKQDADKTSLTLAKAITDKFISRTRFNSAFEVLFKDYYVNEDGSITMHYDLSYNGFPIIMDQDVKETYGMEAPIQVVVQGEEIVSYKRVLREVDEMLPQDAILEVRYVSALDQYITETGELEEPISKMYLGYRWNTTELDMGLNWVIEINTDVSFVAVD